MANIVPPQITSFHQQAVCKIHTDNLRGQFYEVAKGSDNEQFLTHFDVNKKRHNDNFRNQFYGSIKGKKRSFFELDIPLEMPVCFHYVRLG